MNLKLDEVRFTTKMVAGVITLIFLTILIITITKQTSSGSRAA